MDKLRSPSKIPSEARSPVRASFRRPTGHLFREHAPQASSALKPTVTTAADMDTTQTLLLLAGVQPRVVMNLLGHANIRTTMDTYSHVLPAMAVEAASAMTTLLPADDHPEERGEHTRSSQIG